MEPVTVQYAQEHLSALLAAVERGTEIVIEREERPVARLAPLQEPQDRDLGFVRYAVPDEFFEPLREGEVSAWAGHS
ncbi:MAG: type II toxin-antitoxin system prevent-host-death family antitoxin [Actinomycetales bacterium]|nr:type II toxin-antitoxin system prevent-host-death family antitoxin [Actinomycetales bacterium]